MKIVIAEDQEMSRLILAGHLREAGHEVIETCDGKEAYEAILEDTESIDMLITDWSMPNMNGLELAQKVRQLTAGKQYMYIIMLTARNEFNDKFEGFSQGGVDDYIVKPFEGSELILRVSVGGRLVEAERRQRHINLNLQQIVEEQTCVIRETQEEIVHRLFSALESRDGETGGHVFRIGFMSEAMGRLLGWPQEYLDVIRSAAPLHDLGKIGISDTVLRKPGKLTDDEFRIIQEHPDIGANLLTLSKNPIIRMGEIIARYHHENWDGTGYPEKLAGDQIPIEARIVSIVDVYDALMSHRVYRPGLPEDQVIEMLKEYNGTKFDPMLLQLFLENLEYIKASCKEFLNY